MTQTIVATLPPPPPPDRTGRPWTRRLLAAGALAGPLFVGTFLVAGATRAHYDPLRHPVSSLELGAHGWVQHTSFVVAGLLALALAAGLRRAWRPSIWAPLLVGIWGLGLIAAGIFTTDPVGGYPPGTPDRPVHATVPGTLHDAGSLAGFIALVVACFVVGRRSARLGQRGWAAYSVLTGVVFVVALVLASIAFSQTGALVGVGGLIQRIMATSGWLWLTLLALRTRRNV
jgi:hypothetical membrane protein